MVAGSSGSREAEPAPSLRVVGFDTATDDTAVAALDDGRPVHEVAIAAPQGGRPLHAVALLPEVERAAEAAGGWQAVGLVAVGLGPGSYTGLRIGIATARGLKAALGMAVVGVGSLDALGRGIRPRAGLREGVAVIDARRGEVFAALFSARGERIWGPLVCAPELLAERLRARPGPLFGAGSGALRFRHELAVGGVEVPEDPDPVHRVSALHVCALGAEAFGTDAGSLDPIYLRPPDAERWRERDTAKRPGG